MTVNGILITFWICCGSFEWGRQITRSKELLLPHIIFFPIFVLFGPIILVLGFLVDWLESHKEI